MIHQKNAGISSACNTGMAIAKGKYMIQLDNDDYLNDDVLFDLQRKIEIENYPDIMQCNWSKEEDGKIYNHMQSLPENIQCDEQESFKRHIISYIEYTTPVSFWSRAVKMDFMHEKDIKFRSEYDGIQDLDGTFQCFLNTTSVYYYDIDLSTHRIVKTSFSVHQSPRLLGARIKFYSDYYKKFDDKNLDIEIMTRYRNKLSYFMREVYDTIFELEKSAQKDAYQRIKNHKNIKTYASIYHEDKIIHLREKCYQIFGAKITHIGMKYLYKTIKIYLKAFKKI